MEPRGQDKDVVLPYSSLASNYHSSSNSYKNESSAKGTSVLAAAASLGDRRIRNEGSRSSGATSIPSSSQTLDHHLHHLLQNPPPPRQQQFMINIEPNNDPDPDPVQVANATVPSASNSKTTPQQQPPPPPEAPVGNNNNNTSPSSTIRYRECLKNHAASKGIHVIDGCGEFMPGGEEALRCAACDCHRNFHRKEIDGEPPHTGTSSYQGGRLNNTSVFRAQAQTSLITMTHHETHHHQHNKFSHGFSGGLSTSPTGPMAPMMMAFGGNTGGTAAESSSEDLGMFHYNAGSAHGLMHQSSFSASKKRFRTKFSQQQKDRMNEFAEKLGWKIQKQDDQEVQQFCSEVGVKRQVFKVWMHNNKQAMKKKHK